MTLTQILQEWHPFVVRFCNQFFINIFKNQADNCILSLLIYFNFELLSNSSECLGLCVKGYGLAIIRVTVSKKGTAVNEAFHFREHSCYLVPRQNLFCDCHSKQSLCFFNHAFENSTMVWSERYIEFQTHYMGLKEFFNFFLPTVSSTRSHIQRVISDYLR